MMWLRRGRHRVRNRLIDCSVIWRSLAGYPGKYPHHGQPIGKVTVSTFSARRDVRKMPKRKVLPADYIARRSLYLPEKARYDWIMHPKLYGSFTSQTCTGALRVLALL